MSSRPMKGACSLKDRRARTERRGRPRRTHAGDPVGRDARRMLPGSRQSSGLHAFQSRTSAGSRIGLPDDDRATRKDDACAAGSEQVRVRQASHRPEGAGVPAAARDGDPAGFLSSSMLSARHDVGHRCCACRWGGCAARGSLKLPGGQPSACSAGVRWDQEQLRAARQRLAEAHPRPYPERLRRPRDLAHLRLPTRLWRQRDRLREEVLRRLAAAARSGKRGIRTHATVFSTIRTHVRS